MRDRETAIAYGLMIVSPLLMATNPVIGRAVNEIVPPVGLSFWRWLVAFVIVLPFAARGLVRHAPTLKARWRQLLVLGALGMGVCGAFVYQGLADTTATNVGLLYAISPVVILLIAGEPVRPRQWLGVALAIAGVAIILSRGRPTALLALELNVGDLWVLAAVVAWAVYSVMLKRAGQGLPTLTLFAAIILAGVLVLAPFYAIETLAGRPVVADRATLAGIAGVAIVSSILAFSTYQKGVTVLGPARAGPFMYLMPVYGAALAALTLGEDIAPFHAVGLVLILPGVALATLMRRQPLAPATAMVSER